MVNSSNIPHPDILPQIWSSSWSESTIDICEMETLLLIQMSQWSFVGCFLLDKEDVYGIGFKQVCPICTANSVCICMCVHACASE